MELAGVNGKKHFDGFVFEDIKVPHGGILGKPDADISVFLPPAACAGKKCPVIYWLSGLTCNTLNFTTKGCAFKTAAKLGLILIMPDTSPRGDDVPDEEPHCYDFGPGAGFYLNATTDKYKGHYNMYTYITEILPAFLTTTFANYADFGNVSIMGHSMGGHGALTIAVKNQDKFKSCSAFAPICNPTQCPWGSRKDFNN